MAISSSQRQQLRTSGYTTFPAVSDAAEITRIRASLTAIIEGAPYFGETRVVDFHSTQFDPASPQLPLILNPSQTDPWLAETRFRRTVTAIAREILGPETIFSFDHAFMKPARHGAETAWHQDIASHHPHDWHRNLTFWMPLQDVDEGNGCLHYLPGSHRGPILRHRPVSADGRAHGLGAPPPPPGQSVTVPLAAGEFILHESRILHFAGANRTGVPRLSYAVAFRVPRRNGLAGWRQRLFPTRFGYMLA